MDQAQRFFFTRPDQYGGQEEVLLRLSPYDPALKEYWIERKKRHVGRETYQKQRLMLLQRQEYRCALCRIQCIPGEAMETDHITLKSQGGSDDLSNQRLVHPWCHRQRHQAEKALAAERKRRVAYANGQNHISDS
jgi:RNA-directed DNA polymerase